MHTSNPSKLHTSAQHKVLNSELSSGQPIHHFLVREPPLPPQETSRGSLPNLPRAQTKNPGCLPTGADTPLSGGVFFPKAGIASQTVASVRYVNCASPGRADI